VKPDETAAADYGMDTTNEKFRAWHDNLLNPAGVGCASAPYLLNQKAVSHGAHGGHGEELEDKELSNSVCGVHVSSFSPEHGVDPE
jgi:hypothetical protein